MYVARFDLLELWALLLKAQTHSRRVSTAVWSERVEKDVQTAKDKKDRDKRLDVSLTTGGKPLYDCYLIGKAPCLLV